MQAIDIVKPAPKTEHEAFERWKNRMQSELQTLSYYKKRKIEVTDGSVDWGKIHGDSKADAEHARAEDEAMQDLG